MIAKVLLRMNIDLNIKHCPQVYDEIKDGSQMDKIKFNLFGFFSINLFHIDFVLNTHTP